MAFLKRLWGMAMVLTSATALVACGGGSSGGSMLPGGTDNGGSGGTSTTYKLKLTAVNTATGETFDAANGALVYGNPLRVTATLTDSTGAAVSGQVVTVTADSSSVVLDKSGKLLTGTDGVSDPLSVAAAAPSSSGSVTLTATASIVLSGSTASASATLAFRINASNSTTPTGVASYLKYVSTTPTRLFVSGGAQGVNNAAEEAVTTFQAFDKDGNKVAGAVVYFDVTKRNGDILTNGVATPVSVTADTEGVASVTVKSGTDPISINVIASLKPIASSASTDLYYSNDQIVISNLKPDQRQFSLLWSTSATCNSATSARTYPCGFSVTVGDQNGQPVADGTVVNFVSDTGVIVADKLAGQPSGACLTVNSQCSAQYTGKGAVALGAHHIIAYTVGYGAPTNKPITLDGSWIDNGSNVVVKIPDADSYLRNCLIDAGSATNTCQPL
jgi:hypothetical protein